MKGRMPLEPRLREHERCPVHGVPMRPGGVRAGYSLWFCPTCEGEAGIVEGSTELVPEECTDPSHVWHGSQSDDAEGRPLCMQCGKRGPRNYDASLPPACELCGRTLPSDRTRYSIRQCCKEGHDRDTRAAARGERGFTAAEFLSRVQHLALEVKELQEETASSVEPTPGVAIALGVLTVVSQSLHMLAECGEPDDWKAIVPCPECKGTVQHRLGCSRD